MAAGKRMRLTGRTSGWARAALAAFALAVACGTWPALAVEAVSIRNDRNDAPAIDLTTIVELIKTEIGQIQVSAAPGPDGIVRRMQQPAREGSTN